MLIPVEIGERGCLLSRVNPVIVPVWWAVEIFMASKWGRERGAVTSGGHGPNAM